MIETDAGCYVVRLISEFDEEATASRKEEIISQRQSDFYTQTYESWESETEFVLNEKVWDKVNFDAPLTITTVETEE